MQNWKSLGLIYKPNKNFVWSKSHCMLPTIYKLGPNKIRVFFGSRNKKNVSSVGFVDLSYLKDKFKVLKYSRKPVLMPGNLGAFDDNGVLPSCIIKKKDYFYLFYIGWRPSVITRYSLISGLAKSKSLNSFKRVSKAPLLKLSDIEPYQILTAPTILKKGKLFFMWYVSCNKWKNKDFPIYDIKFATSKNLMEWNQTGLTCISLKKGERAIARPFVIFENNLFKMWYCYEKALKGYKLGYAESLNGKEWKRKDKEIKFDYKSKGENKMQAYPQLVNIKKKVFMFYNGNNYGRDGIFCALLKK